MQALNRMNADEIAPNLQSLPLWSLDTGLKALCREFRFSDFGQAFMFMTQVAKAAETHNHHPEWRNVYNKVWVTWTTHDVDGLSLKDIQMAKICDQLFSGPTS
ncbi:4a-hydroxytetrahydrobiopterin dehydratase [Limnohabitans sp. Rim11]|jgi:4a-hydroxytetrahydrobiopterin dehydratase|uniref:4a-hydroxytetrahydrobiopterin dehydratase n=1 Tax=Limnohabitans sp. Rim11 TaxID=1100719 RepID=UPI000ADE6AE4|nr:4a-hydroxytetrahydrobiopterin dehydratase [Limnohabitans sp. Rim11]